MKNSSRDCRLNGSSCVLSQNASFAARRMDAQFYYYYRNYARLRSV